MTLPEPPEGVAACLRKSFPEVPDRDLIKRDVMRTIARAAVLDRVKSDCGLRAVEWIEKVRAEFAQQPEAQ